MDTTTVDKQILWSLLYDLITNIPAPLLAGVRYLTVLVIVIVLVAAARRVWSGDRFEVGPVKLERSERVTELQTALDTINRDDKLKLNVLWIFRARLREANEIVAAGLDAEQVRTWCGDVLGDIATVLSRGGDDRHRVSLWLRQGDDLRMYNGAGFRETVVDDATLPMLSIAGTVFRTGLSHNTSDVDDERAYFPKPRSGSPYQSLLSVPVKASGGETIATLCVDAQARGYFDGNDEFFAGCFADLIALLVAQVIDADD